MSLLNASTLYYSLPLAPCLSLSLFLSLYVVISPGVFIRPPSSTSFAPFLSALPLSLFTAKQYTIPSRSGGYVSRVFSHASEMRDAPHRGWLRLHSSLRFTPKCERARGLFPSDRGRVYIVRATGSALIRKLYEYRVTCYLVRASRRSSRRRKLRFSFRGAQLLISRKFFRTDYKYRRA